MKSILNKVEVKLFLIFFVFSVPLLIVMIVYNYYTINLVRKQVVQSNQNLVTLYMDQVDTSLEAIDKYLYENSASNADLLYVDLPSENNNQKYYLSKLQLHNQFTKDINSYKKVDMFFVYSSVNSDLMCVKAKDIEYEEKLVIEREMNRFLSDKHYMKGYNLLQWDVLSIKDSYYILHVLKSGNVYIGAIIKADKLMVDTDLLDLGDNGKVIMVTSKNEPMYDTEYIVEYGVDITFAENKQYLSGEKERFLIVGKKSSKGDFGMVTLIQDSVILEKLPLFQAVLSISAPILLMVFGTVYLLITRKIIIRPINDILNAMKEVKAGNLDVSVINKKSSNEFEIMVDTFNNMVSNIKKLKIEIYEEKINKQNAELKHLQLQINPHFFLNSINMIYQLAVVKDFEIIKDMSVCLIDYFRFMYRDNSSFILLEEELKHTQNYLRIQEMRFSTYLSHSIVVLKGLSKYMVPPLIIQTFVENAIKYAVTMDDPIQISIVIDIIGTITNPRVQISISDTGKGFSDKVLKGLQRDNVKPFIPDNIGIWNAQRRLRLLYKGEANIYFYNRASGGAVVEMDLPLKVESLLKEVSKDVSNAIS